MDEKETVIPEPKMASDVLADNPELTAAIKESENDPKKTFAVDKETAMRMKLAMERYQRKMMREAKARAPKHENFRECHRKCPFFKEKECFKLSADAQQKCWTQMLGAIGSLSSYTTMIDHCGFSCSKCALIKKCLSANKDKFSEKPELFHREEAQPKG